MGKQADHREVLEGLAPEAWDAYLAAESALPGPRANLELLQAVADVADPGRIRRYASSADEYQAACGAVALGRLLAQGDAEAAAELRALAADERWRVREGVAMALPDEGFPRMERLASLGDPDVRWVVRENLKKARLARADPVRTARLAEVLRSRAPT